jgi:hypothetical protein
MLYELLTSVNAFSCLVALAYRSNDREDTSVRANNHRQLLAKFNNLNRKMKPIKPRQRPRPRPNSFERKHNELSYREAASE